MLSVEGYVARRGALATPEVSLGRAQGIVSPWRAVEASRRARTEDNEPAMRRSASEEE